MIVGTIVLIARRDSARKYYIHARTSWLELNQPQTTADSVTDVKMKRNIVTFQFIGLQAKVMELIDMMDNPIET